MEGRGPAAADVLVAFNQHSRRPRRLPSVSGYRRVVGRRFLRRYPWVRNLSVWNEANASYQPTARRPKRAAQYYSAMRAACRRCRVVAADMLDRPGVYRWLRRFKRYLRGRPRLWGIHNYVDANRGRRRPSGRPRPRLTRRLPGRVWLTETGGLVAFRRARGAAIQLPLRRGRARPAPRRGCSGWPGPDGHARLPLPLARAKGAHLGLQSVDRDGRARPALEVLRREVNRQRRLRLESLVPFLPEWLPDGVDPVASPPNGVPAEPAPSPPPRGE